MLSNAAREPEIEDLARVLNTCGAEITGAGTSTVVIRGGRPLHGGTYTILPDRIAAATYLCGAASAGGEVFLRDVHGGAPLRCDGAAPGGGLRRDRRQRRDRVPPYRRLTAPGPSARPPILAFPPTRRPF